MREVNTPKPNGHQTEKSCELIGANYEFAMFEQDIRMDKVLEAEEQLGTR